MKAPEPSGATATAHLDLQHVTCVGTAFCVATGTYVASSDGAQLPVAEVFSGGTWTVTVPPLPPTASMNGGFSTPSCPEIGVCVAVGQIDVNDRGPDQGIAETLSDGSWTATMLPLPAGSASNANLQLSTVVCQDSDSCLAAGSASVNDGLDINGQSVVETLSGGSWTATVVALPTDASSNDSTPVIGGLACPSASRCIATGEYIDTGGVWQGLLETLSGGTWTSAKAVLPPDASAGGQSQLGAVSCPATGHCTAVGYYVDDNAHVEGLIETLSDGTWGAVEAPVPPDAAPNPEVNLVDVACPAVDSCVAVSQYAVSGSSYLGLIDTLSGGTWTAAAAPSAPGSVADSIDVLGSVDCAFVGSCSAVGTESRSTGGVSDVGLLATLSGAVPAPTISDVSPGSGPSGGGTAVTVTGTGFSTKPSVSVFDFGGSEATDTVCSSSTSCTMTAPSGTGTVDVVADVAGQSSSPGPADQFTYLAASSLSLVPLSGLPVATGPAAYGVSVAGTGPTPTGSVTISDNQGGQCTVADLASGSGSCAIQESATQSPYTVTAEYSGDAAHSPSTASMTVSTSVSTGGSATAGTNGTTAAAVGGTDGVDTLNETQYGADPVGALTDGQDFFDVSVSAASTFGAVVVTDCNAVTSATQLLWWDPSASAGAGGWAAVVGDPGPTYSASPESCLTVTLDATSSPSVAQLTGTVFGAEVPEVLTIETSSLPHAVHGAAYGPVALVAGGAGVSTSPYLTTLKWKKVSLPKGLKLSKDGVLSGSVSKTVPTGANSVTVQVTATVTTLNGRKKVKTLTTVLSTIPIVIQ